MNRRSFLRTLIAVPFVGAALYSGVERLVVKPYIRMTGAPYFSEWLGMPMHFVYAAKWLQWCEVDGKAQVVLVPIYVTQKSLYAAVRRGAPEPRHRRHRERLQLARGPRRDHQRSAVQLGTAADARPLR